MKSSASDVKHKIQCAAWTRLDNLNFGDDLLLLYHTHDQMQMKTAGVAAAFAEVDFNIHREKRMILNYNTERTNTIKLEGETLE
ncbi:unnamed protein product [Schistosoma margrebowiei]|uniref:Uncharacterized protein n=1 Tax=Schistosoma margrebowiei TaxID=48269 RepID=A0A183M864_9TREM|nr:unnamed protein product [Schistosoma margrebowiei]